jgi:serine/threonine protein kinase
MAFLASKKVIHRDLAARNILVDTNGNNSFSAVDQWKCKIADFGFARDIMANNMYERKTDGKLPIRWMAPETIQDNLYTAKSDVWSFGVLMWEIVTLGSTPYVGMGAKEVIKYVNDGNRLQMPKHCKRELYNIMFYCWNADPTKRPDWSGPDSLITDFEKLLLENTDYIDLNMYPEHEYYNEVDLSGEKV